MINTQNNVVARGKHVKFLPVNWIYDNFISQPCILDLLISALYQDRPTILGQKILDSVFHTEKIEDNNLQQKSNIFDRFSLNNEGGSFAFLVKKIFCNPFGMLHGGCAAMMAEHAVRKTKDQYPEQIDVTYLNGVSLSSVANIELLKLESDNKSNILYGTIQKQGKCAVQFSMTMRAKA